MSKSSLLSKTVGEEDGHPLHGNSLTRENNSNQSRPQGDYGSGATTIQRFYSGASVFVTGATGYLGKVLIEKLLYSCPDIDSIYMLVRQKKGRNTQERVEDFISSPCFSRLKDDLPKLRFKLHVVAGDIALEGLGLSDNDKHLLAQQVDIVFHIAATVNFNAQLTSAILMNVRGTREMLNLCRTFKKLRSVIHVSTAYANCPLAEIDECFYDPPFPSDRAIYMAETLDRATMDHLSHKLIGKWPNSYAFTKAISEHAVLKYGQGLPAGVFRPSVVICTSNEPMPGWIDNLYGPAGVIVAASAGLLRTMMLNTKNEANMVPCDMVINGLIAAAWDVAGSWPNQDFKVFNYIAPKDNAIHWEEYMNMHIEKKEELTSSKAIWYPTMTMTTYRSLFMVYQLFLHLLPALLMDLFLLATKKSPQMISIFNKIRKLNDALIYFSSRQWKFEDRNVASLWEKLDPQDKETFNFDMRSLNWQSYINNTCEGVNLYLLKETPDTLPAKKAHVQRLYVLHRFTQCLLVCLAIWVLSLVVLPTRLSTTQHTMDTPISGV